MDNGEVFPLLEIIDFISSTVETNNTNCAWSQARNLPLGVSTLDYKSLALDVKTDMAVHLAKVTPNKDKEYKKPYGVERGHSPEKYEKYTSESRNTKSTSNDRNSSRRTARSPSQKGFNKPGSRNSSRDNNNSAEMVHKTEAEDHPNLQHAEEVFPKKSNV